MSVGPILKIDDILVITLLDVIGSTQNADVLMQVGETLASNGSRGVVIDVSRLPLVDSHMAAALAGLVGMARLLGGEAVISGIRPEVAITMVELGIALPDVATVSDVDRAIASLRQRREVRS